MEVDYFGGCPTCGKNNGCVNAGRTHVFFCKEHKVSWIFGANLFSSWREQTEAQQREQYKQIEGFERVEPLWPDDPADALDALTEAEREAAKAFADSLDDEVSAADVARWKAAQEQREALCEKITASLVDVLKASPPDVPPGEQFRFVVGESVLTLTSEGVIKQDRAAPDDIPF